MTVSAAQKPPGAALLNQTPAKQPSISVLIPARDAATTLEATLESVRRQTLTDFECLIVNDGSVDATAAVAARMTTRDSRFQLINTEPRGLVSALNTGLEDCRSTLIARMDADDLMRRDRLERQHAAFANDPVLALLGTHTRIFPQARMGRGLHAYQDWLQSIRTPAAIRRDRFIESPLPHPTWMIRRSVLTEFPYRETRWSEDYDLILRLAEADRKLDVLPQRLLLWREHPGRLTHRAETLTIESFVAAKAHFLVSGPLRESSRYILCGYGHTGRALRRALLAYDRQPSHIVDVHPRRLGKIIHGAPVVPVTALPELPTEPILVSVAGAGPRQKVRAELTAVGRVEGRDFFCTA
jgi:glycosyltransferase involved in cell wall biosynthesis